MPNARLSERAPFFAEVDILAAGAPAPRRVWGSDVSEAGMFLNTRHAFRAGDRVSLRFDCQDNAVHIRVAEVIWVRPCEPLSVDGKLPGVGLKFVALDPSTRAALRKFIAPLVPTSRRRDTLPETHERRPPPVASLAPVISQPPHQVDAPAPVTIGPCSEKPLTGDRPHEGEASPTPAKHLLAAWTFRRDQGDGRQSEAAAVPRDVTLSNTSTLDLRFTDEGPGVRSPAEHIGDEDAFRAAVESAVTQGNLAIKSLPIAEALRASPVARRTRRALPVAIALLCSGTLAGVLLGTVMRKIRPRAPIVAIASGTRPPPATMAVMPRPKENAPVVTASTPTPTLTASMPATKLAPQASSLQTPSVAWLANAGSGVNERRSIELRVGDAHILRAFTLASPSRIVVDIQGGQLPKTTLLPGEGIAKVRFGSPAPDTGRIVVELDRAGRANGIEAWVKAGVFVLTFR